MKYITEINSFYDWLIYNELSPNAALLWHVLMQFNNKCPIEVKGQFFWRVRFSVANSRLKNTIGFTSNMQLQRARDELIAAGRIRYESGSTRNAGTYQMVHFDAYTKIRPLGELLKPHGISVTKDLAETLVYCYQSVTNNVTNLLLNPLTLIDIDIDKDKDIDINNPYGDGGITRVREHKQGNLDKYIGMTEKAKQELDIIAHDLVSENFMRRALPADTEAVCDKLWSKHGIDYDKLGLLKYSFAQAARAGKLTWSYVDGIYSRLLSRGIKTYDDCIEYDIQREFEKDRRNGVI